MKKLYIISGQVALGLHGSNMHKLLSSKDSCLAEDFLMMGHTYWFFEPG